MTARKLTCFVIIEGVAREVAALYGERPPPVAVYEEKKTYRAKRQNTGPAKKWYGPRVKHIEAIDIDNHSAGYHNPSQIKHESMT